jgi:2OG-Fe(II) oxygenase superfamily
VAERAVLYPGRQEAAMDAQWVAKDILTIDHFLSQGECDDYVKRGEDKGFEEASVSTQRGMVMMKNVRNNDRVIMDDASLAGHLWQRVQPFVPLEFEKWHPVGLNERFRFYRYDIGQRFDWHQDGCFERPNGERSFSTFMVYLNADFEGGETSFSTSSRSSVVWASVKVKPEVGKALLFHHPITHKGETVVAGRKYVLRSDLMFALADRGKGNVVPFSQRPL